MNFPGNGMHKENAHDEARVLRWEYTHLAAQVAQEGWPVGAAGLAMAGEGWDWGPRVVRVGAGA